MNGRHDCCPSSCPSSGPSGSGHDVGGSVRNTGSNATISSVGRITFPIFVLCLPAPLRVIQVHLWPLHGVWDLEVGVCLLASLAFLVVLFRKPDGVWHLAESPQFAIIQSC